MKNYILMCAGIFSLVVLSACSTTSDNISGIDAAKTEYEYLDSNPMYTEHAPEAMMAAKKQIEKLEAMHRQGVDEQEFEHQLYITERKLDIARALAEKNAAEERVASSEVRRQNILLSAKERELLEKQEEAETAKMAATVYAAEAHAAREELDDIRTRAQQLEDEVEDLKMKETERGLVLSLNNILFELNKSELKPGADRTINKVAEFLNEYPDRTVTIEGFTDSTGDEDYNQALSEERAVAVARGLVQQGVDAERVETVGYGESNPVASNDTRAGRQQNRRVEIVISDEANVEVSGR